MRRAPFVGRGKELAQVRETLSAAHQGSGSVVLVEGEPGIGKTSFADQVSNAAARLDMPVAWGPAIEAEATPPYWCWRQVLQALARLTNDATIGAFRWDDSHPSQFALFEDVVTRLHRAAAPNALLLVLYDLHWADAGSLRLLQVAATHIPSTRLVILGTYRQPIFNDSSPLEHILPALLRERAVYQLRLTGLQVNQTQALLTELLDRPVVPTLLQEFVERTDGNPFYIVELAESYRHGDSSGRLPRSLQTIAQRRLGLVGQACHRTLASASVIGRDFDLNLLTATTCQDAWPTMQQLAEAVDAGLLDELAPGHYRFAHALLREALYSELSIAERASAHARVAVAIEQLGPAARSNRIEALAHHLRWALPLVDARKVVSTLLETAEAAEAQLAFEQAADRYAQILELVTTTSEFGLTRSNLLVKQAHCHFRSGALATAWHLTQQAAVAARQENNARALADAALVMRGTIDSAYAAEMFALCRDALLQLAGSDPVLEARVLAQMSVAAALITPGGTEPGLADRALATARNTDDVRARLLALQAKELAIAGAPERAGERLALSTEAVEAAERAADPALAVWAHGWRLGASWELGLRGQADAELAAMTEAVERIKDPLARWRLEIARATLGLIDGRY